MSTVLELINSDFKGVLELSLGELALVPSFPLDSEDKLLVEDLEGDLSAYGDTLLQVL